MEAPATARPAAYSIDQAAKQLSISRTGVYRLIDAGQIRRVKIGHRSVIPATEIDRILNDGAGPDAA